MPCGCVRHRILISSLDQGSNQLHLSAPVVRARPELQGCNSTPIQDNPVAMNLIIPFPGAKVALSVPQGRLNGAKLRH